MTLRVLRGLRGGRAAILGIGVAVSAAGCPQTASGPDVYDPNAIFLDLTVQPEQVQVGEVVTFTISAHAVEKSLVSSSIDYENDGVWDETRPNDDTTIAEQYRHAYAAPGEYTVRARVVDSSGKPAVKTGTVSVVVYLIR